MINMKQLTTYINEKANFIVKKHVTNTYEYVNIDKVKIYSDAKSCPNVEECIDITYQMSGGFSDYILLDMQDLIDDGINDKNNFRAFRDGLKKILLSEFDDVVLINVKYNMSSLGLWKKEDNKGWTMDGDYELPKGRHYPKLLEEFVKIINGF